MRRRKSGVVGLVICFVAVIAIAGTMTFRGSDKQSEKEDSVGTEEEKLVENPEEEEESDEISRPTQGDDVQAEIEEQDTSVVDAPVQKEELSFDEKTVLKWPVDGNVIMNYSMDESIYFATLDQYKYHPAILIAGEVGEEVWAAEDGEITAIENRAETGWTVTVDMGDGYEAVYGQLKKVSKSEGDRIEKGELLGYLEKPTKYYSVEGCNLYFQLLKDGEPVNPLEYLDV